ncbi:MAG: DNA translocase FtsK 4TM domain-containing protein, partial [Myxococcota bacterium]
MWREIAGLLLLATALAILLAVVSFSPADVNSSSTPSNLIGPVGVTIGDALLYLFGVGAFFFDALLWYLGFMLLVGRIVEWKWSEITGQLLFVLSGAMLCHLTFFEYNILGHMPGGLVGEVTGEILRGLFGTVGTAIIGVSFLLLSLMLATDMSLGALVRKLMSGVHRSVAWARHKWTVHKLYRQRVKEERRKLLEQDLDEDELAKKEAELSVKPLVDGEYEYDAEKEVEDKLGTKLARFFGGGPDKDNEDNEPKKKAKKTEKTSKKKDDEPEEAEAQADEVEASGEWEMGDPMETEPEIEDDEPEIVIRNVESGADVEESSDDENLEVIDMASEKKASGNVDADFGPQIVESDAQKRSREKKEQLADDNEMLFKPKRKGDYELPPINFLNYDD